MAVGLAFLGGPAVGRKNEISLSAGCTLKNNQYTCDQTKFDSVFSNAKTVAIETAPTDAVAQNH